MNPERHNKQLSLLTRSTCPRSHKHIQENLPLVVTQGQNLWAQPIVLLAEIYDGDTIGHTIEWLETAHIPMTNPSFRNVVIARKDSRKSMVDTLSNMENAGGQQRQ